MKTHIRHLAAAALAAGSLSFAYAQGPIAPHDQQVPLVDEPTASATTNDDQMKQLVEALNQDASLKGSKITIQPENVGERSVLWITGVTKTEAQMNRVSDIAGGLANGMKVANLIQAEHIATKTPNQYVPAETAELEVSKRG